jgi:hypothetical protein
MCDYTKIELINFTPLQRKPTRRMKMLDEAQGAGHEIRDVKRGELVNLASGAEKPSSHTSVRK